MTAALSQTPHILLVEDNADDIYFVETFLERSETQAHLHVVRDGMEAWHFLKRENSHSEAPRPSLILLDLKLPKLSGLDLLKRIKGDKSLRAIPVVVLAASGTDADAAASYDLHATSFITKPRNLEAFNQVMERIFQFWLGLAKLPR